MKRITGFVTVTAFSFTALGGVAAVTLTGTVASAAPAVSVHGAQPLADGAPDLPTPAPTTPDPCSSPASVPDVTCTDPIDPSTWGWG